MLEHPEEPLLKASQLPLLIHFAEHRPDKFCKKLRIYPVVFNDILQEISDHPIFQNQSNNRQMPILIQLAIFLYHVGHYRNTCSPDDVAQWAGVSVGTVMNYTHHVMASLLDQHNRFIYTPDVHLEDMRQAQGFVESRTCRAWRNGVFVADGTAVNLHARPGMFGNGFCDRKSNFSLNCQVCMSDGRVMRQLTMVQR